MHTLHNAETQLTRDVDQQDRLQRPCKLWLQRPRGLDSLVDQEALATNARRVQHVKGVVTQPGDQRRLEAAQAEYEVRVAHDFGDAPGNEHAGVGREGRQRWEDVDDGPNEQQAACDLHSCGQDRGAHDACMGLASLMSHRKY
jgi:hypothetical protein